MTLGGHAVEEQVNPTMEVLVRVGTERNAQESRPRDGPNFDRSGRSTSEFRRAGMALEMLHVFRVVTLRNDV
jgi:hypothetical protein